MGKREEKKEKRRQIWMSIILSVVMITSVFGVLLGSQSNELRYNKHKFTVVDNTHYSTKIDGKQIAFYSLPPETAQINVSSVTVNKIKEAYFVAVTFDPNVEKQSLAMIELSRFDFATAFTGKTVVSGVTNSSSEYSGLPIMSCANATLKTPVIYFNISNVAGIADIDNCIYINGRGNEIIRMRDRMLYAYYGVIPNG
jgi:hypothetical protein